MELVHYLRIVRRRWRTVAVFAIIGVLVGAGTVVFRGARPAGPNVTYYLAKHTLSSADGSANLSRAAALATDSEVPRRAAAKLGLDSPATIKESVRAEARPDVGLLYVAAVSTDPQRSVAIADTFAEELSLYLREAGDQQKKSILKQFDEQLDAKQNEYRQIQEQVNATTDTAQKQLLNDQLKSVSSRISELRQQRSAAEVKQTTSENLTTLNTAEPVPISQAAYEKLISGEGKTDTKSSSLSNVPASQIDAAISSGSTSGPMPRGAMGGAVGMLIGMLFVIVADRVDPRIRTKFEAEEAFGWPVIGEIPPMTRRERHDGVVLSWAEPRSRTAEAFRVLRSALLFATAAEDNDSTDDHPVFANTPRRVDTSTGTAGVGDDDNAGERTDEAPADGEGANDAAISVEAPAERTTPARGQVIMVSSPGPSEGKTTTTANLAAILAETGRSVIVVNCDFRRPRVHTLLDADQEDRKVIDTGMDGVKLITHVTEGSEEANPADVVAAQRQVIRNARELFDIVLLDTAPLLTTNDATEVLGVTDQVLVVAKAGKTHKEAADRAAELLERRNAPVVGVVLIAATDVPTARYYYYGGVQPETVEPEPGEEDATPLEVLLEGEPVGRPIGRPAASTGASGASGASGAPTDET